MTLMHAFSTTENIEKVAIVKNVFLLNLLTSLRNQCQANRIIKPTSTVDFWLRKKIIGYTPLSPVEGVYALKFYEWFTMYAAKNILN